MKKVLVVTGVTATGKTALAVRVAIKIGADIISADSRQVYKGMNIGTGKDIGKSKFKSVTKLGQIDIGYHVIGGIRVWLLDAVEPNVRFSVSDYIKAFDETYRQIEKRHRAIVVAGGSGFYVESILNPKQNFGVPPKRALRWFLGKLPIWVIVTVYKLISFGEYGKLNNSEKNNKYRLIRKIEICLSKKRNKKKMNKKYRAIVVCLTANNRFIYQQIDKRVESRLKQGLIDEIRKLEKKYGWKASGMNCLAYNEFRDYLAGSKSLEECVKKWKYDEHAYARRQKTWFKKKNYKMIDVENTNVDGTIFYE